MRGGNSAGEESVGSRSTRDFVIIREPIFKDRTDNNRSGIHSADSRRDGTEWQSPHHAQLALDFDSSGGVINARKITAAIVPIITARCALTGESFYGQFHDPSHDQFRVSSHL